MRCEIVPNPNDNHKQLEINDCNKDTEFKRMTKTFQVLRNFTLNVYSSKIDRMLVFLLDELFVLSQTVF